MMLTETVKIPMALLFRVKRGRRWRKQKGAWCHEDGDVLSGEFEAR